MLSALATRLATCELKKTLMPIAIYALMAVNFAIGTQTFVFAGLIADLALDLNVSIGVAGTLITAAAVTFAFGAPIAAFAIFHLERRRVILIGLIVLLLANLVAALTTEFWTLFGARVIAGIGNALAGSAVTVAVTLLVPQEKRGKAFAMVAGGLTVAFMLGIPIGTAIGGFYGWRSTFIFAAIMIAIAIALVIALIPALTPEQGERPTISQAFSNREVNRFLLLTLLGFVSLFTVVAYQGPLITHAVGVTGSGIGWYQLFIGLGSFAGLAAGGVIASRRLGKPGLRWIFLILTLTLLAYWKILQAPAQSTPEAVLALTIFIGAITLFALVPVILTGLSAIAGPLLPVILPINGSLVALGQGIGAFLGGLVTESFGFAWIGLAGMLVALVGLAVTFRPSQA